MAVRRAWMHETLLRFASERHKEEKDSSNPCPFFYSSMQMKKLNKLKEKMTLNLYLLSFENSYYQI